MSRFAIVPFATVYFCWTKILAPQHFADEQILDGHFPCDKQPNYRRSINLSNSLKNLWRLAQGLFHSDRWSKKLPSRKITRSHNFCVYLIFKIARTRGEPRIFWLAFIFSLNSSAIDHSATVSPLLSFFLSFLPISFDQLLIACMTNWFSWTGDVIFATMLRSALKCILRQNRQHTQKTFVATFLLKTLEWKMFANLIPVFPLLRHNCKKKVF